MPQFNDHSRGQFVERRPELFPTEASKHPDTVVRLAHESYYAGRPITREEAAERIHGPVFSGAGDMIFRSDGTGPGVWVVWLTARRAEVVVTYLAPGMTFTFREWDELKQAAAAAQK